MFKRRTPRSYGQMATEMFYPPGGWRRATTYVIHRLRRLPDHPHRIGRGFAAGVFISFTPLFGFHFMLAALIAFVIRGNILAALLGTFFGNPLTTPFIAVSSLALGRWMLGLHDRISPHMIFSEFSKAGHELWNNVLSLVITDRHAHWQDLFGFWHEIFWPYMVGGLLPGIVVATICHYLTVPVIRAYHKRRAKKMAERIARLRALRTPPVAGAAPAASGPVLAQPPRPVTLPPADQ